MAAKRSTLKGSAKTQESPKKFTQSSIFTSRLFTGGEQKELVELSEDSDLEIIEEHFVHKTSVARISMPEVTTTKVEKEPLLNDLDSCSSNLQLVPSLITPNKSSESNLAKEDASSVDTLNVKPENDQEEAKIPSGEVKCPICGLTLDALTISGKTIHVEDCMSFSLTTEEIKQDKFKVTTKSGYVYQSMKQSLALVDKDKTDTPNKRPTSALDREKEKKPKRQKNPIPELKILDFRDSENQIVTKLSMDAFCYKEHLEIQHYFLSHFHSDHYMGICKSWNNGQIYCSLITKKLLEMKFKVDPNIITALEFEKPTIVPNTQVQVTLVDANHCPGSAIFLFENLLTGSRQLHCGDFRINKKMICSPHIYNVPIDTCYLDTTYLNPAYAFPKQEYVIEVVSEFCENMVNGKYSGTKIQKRVTDFFDNTFLHKNKKNYLICIGTYTIGKERIAIDIARRLNTKLYLNLTKRDIMSTFDWETLNDLITDDPFETQVHLIPMSYLNNDNLENYFKPYKKKFQNIVAFRPTGWSFISNGSLKWMNDLTKEQILLQVCRDTEIDKKFNLEKIEKQFKSDRVIQIYGVPYSEHSSFRELSFFCILLQFKRIIPTVNTHNLESIREMELWIKEWKAIKDLKVLDIDLF